MRSPFRGEGSYSLVFCQRRQIRTELYIDNTNAARVNAIFGALHRRRERIEAAYGKPLSWEELPSRRASRVAAYGEGDVLDTDQHDAFVAWFLDTQTRLRRAIDEVLPEVQADLEVDGPSSQWPSEQATSR
jgi:hypothetical protein